jgi:hypothetical protein
MELCSTDLPYANYKCILLCAVKQHTLDVKGRSVPNGSSYVVVNQLTDDDQ